MNVERILYYLLVFLAILFVGYIALQIVERI